MTRRTKAQKAYDALRETAGKLKTVATYDLLKIAQSINPQLEREGQLLILDDSWWTDEHGLTPSLRQLAHGYSSEIFSMRTRLVFAREEIRALGSSKVRRDTRLVYEFERENGKPGKVWLDCETGLPWLPRACEMLIESTRAEKVRRHQEDQAKARRVLEGLNRETAWYHAETDWQNERYVERLEERRRRDYWSDWKTERVLAVRFHPPGSAISDLQERAQWQANRAAVSSSPEQREAA
ncbi:MAG: hypothetical protein AB1705_13055 [Verrucomicrobiota bacterium]